MFLGTSRMKVVIHTFLNASALTVLAMLVSANQPVFRTTRNSNKQLVQCPRIGYCSRSFSCGTACESRKLQDDFTDYRNHLRENGGDVKFFLPLNTSETVLNRVQSTGVSFSLTYESLANSLYKEIRPTETFPGMELIPSPIQAHIWAACFGGPGDYYLNFLALDTEANSKIFEEFESNIQQVQKIFGPYLDPRFRVFVTISVHYEYFDVPVKLYLEADLEYIASVNGKTQWVKETWLSVRMGNFGTKPVEYRKDNTEIIRRKSFTRLSRFVPTCEKKTKEEYIETISFVEGSAAENKWEVRRDGDAPSAYFFGGEVYLTGRDQSGYNKLLFLAPPKTFLLNQGLSMKFRVRYASGGTSQMKLQFFGGIILRITKGGTVATWNTYSPHTGFTILGKSYIPQYEYVTLHIVYRPGNIRLEEAGVLIFDRPISVDSIVEPYIHFIQVDRHTEAVVHVTNMAIHTDLFNASIHQQ